jgi:hypothetical protein
MPAIKKKTQDFNRLSNRFRCQMNINIRCRLLAAVTWRLLHPWLPLLQRGHHTRRNLATQARSDQAMKDAAKKARAVCK